MTWRWKNIHFAGDDPPAGPTDEQLAAQQKSIEAAEKLLGIQKDLVKESRARLRLATTLEEKAAAHRDLFAATTREKEAALEKEKADLIAMGAYSEEEYQRKKKIVGLDQEMRDIATDLGSTVKSFASDWAFIDDKSDDFAQSLWRASQHAGGMKVFLSESATHIVALTSNANILEATWNQIQVGVGLMVMELESSLPAFNKSTGAAGKLNAEIVTATNEVRQYGVGMAEAAASMNALTATVGNFNKLGKTTRTELTALAAGMEQVGVGAETTANLVNSMTNSLGMSTEATMASIKSVAATARALEMPVSALVGALDQAMPRLAQFGKEAPEVLKKVAAASKATGIEIGSLMGIVGQYDTWEGSAEAAGRLNAMLGGPLLNSIDLLKASDEERIRMLIGSMEASGKNWESMGRFERQAIASAAGISDLNEAGKLFSTTLSEYDYQQAEAQQAEENAEAYNEMISAAVPLMEKWEQVYMKAWGALGPIITPVLGMLKAFADFLLEFNPWVLLIGGFVLWIGALKIAGHYARKLAMDLATVTVNAAAEIPVIAALASVHGVDTAAIISESASIAGNTTQQAANNTARTGGIVGMVKSIALRAWTVAGIIAENVWLGMQTVAKWALSAVNWILFGSQTAVNAGNTAAGPAGAVGAAGTTAMGTAAWFAVIPVAILALGIGLLALGLGLMAIAVAAVVWAFVYLVKLFMESPQAAIIAAVGLSFLGVALAILAVGLALVTLVAFPASIALVMLGAASLVAAVGFIALGVGMMMLAVGATLFGLSLAIIAQNFQLIAPLIPAMAAGLWTMVPPITALGLALIVLAVGLLAVTLIAVPASIALVILGYASLIAAVGFTALGIGMIMLAVGATLFSIALEKMVQMFAAIKEVIPEIVASLTSMIIPTALAAFALGALAISLYAVTLIAVPASIALVILGYAALAASVGFMALGVGMMILGVGAATTALALATMVALIPGLFLLATAISVLAVSFASLAVSLLMIAAVAPFLPLIVTVFTTLAVVFTIISLSIALVATQMSNLMESMSELAGTGAVVTIGTSIKEVAEGINEASLLKTVALTGFMGATALAGAAGGGGEKENLAAAVSELRQEVAATNAIYKEIASQPIIIKVGDQTIKKYVDRGIGDKIIAAVRANASTVAGG